VLIVEAGHYFMLKAVIRCSFAVWSKTIRTWLWTQ